MEIDAYTLLLYFAIWTIFYFYLSHYIARLSRDKWVEYIRSEESDEMLIEALGSVIDEIEDRMHDKLEAFQSSFFGSLGAASKKLDQSTGQSTIKALTRDNPIMGFVADYMMKRANLGDIMAGNRGETAPEKPKDSGRLGLR
jgi:hypothetical protein